jgi:diguanylate cyclase (GGDEF)-like protein
LGCLDIPSLVTTFYVSLSCLRNLIVENSSSISIAWSVPESCFSLLDAQEILCSLGLFAQPLKMSEPFETSAELAVLHASNFRDLDHLCRACDQFSRPTLIVVNSRDEETRVFKWMNLPLTIDVCRAEVFSDQLADRLRRLLRATCRGTVLNKKVIPCHDLQKHIYDQEYLKARLAREFANARKHCRSLTIAWVALDNFDCITKTYGDSAGEHLLTAFATTILTHIRVVDWLAYYGEGEFCLVMPDTWLGEGRTVSDRIRKDLSSIKVEIDQQQSFTPSMSIGISELTDHEASYEDLIQKAAEAALTQKISERILGDVEG